VHVGELDHNLLVLLDIGDDGGCLLNADESVAGSLFSWDRSELCADAVVEVGPGPGHIGASVCVNGVAPPCCSLAGQVGCRKRDLFAIFESMGEGILVGQEKPGIYVFIASSSERRQFRELQVL
jgi:hypothetical protein